MRKLGWSLSDVGSSLRWRKLFQGGSFRCYFDGDGAEEEVEGEEEVRKASGRLGSEGF